GVYELHLVSDEHEMLTLPVHGSWNQCVQGLKDWLVVNDSVSVALLHLEKAGETLQVGKDSLLVIEPDWLITVTDMTRVEYCQRQFLLDRYVSSPRSKHMIRGTFVHRVFPEIWGSKRGKELEDRCGEIMGEQIEDFIVSECFPGDIQEKCDEAIAHLTQWIDRRPRTTRLRTETFVLSPFLGMKGKIDFLWEDISRHQIVGIAELKTGRSQGKAPHPGHELQLLSYTMMLLARGEATRDRALTLLLYSGNDMLGDHGSNLHRKIVITLDAVINAVKIRNDLVLMELTGRSRFETNMNKCRKCRNLNVHCARVALLKDEEDPRPVETSSWLGEQAQRPTDSQRTFFQHYSSLISKELRALKEIHADLWRKDPEQREEEGFAFRIQKVVGNQRQKKGFLYELHGENRTEFRVGDAALISDARGPAFGRIAAGVVQAASSSGLSIASDEEIRFEPVWVDAYTTEDLTLRLFKALYRFMVRGDAFHDVILDGASPEFGSLPIQDKSLLKILEKEGLNEHQGAALQAALCALSYCIVHGPPGSGKTKLIRAIVLAHLSLGQRVLICTGTNRALDEAMKSLAQSDMSDETLRIGDPNSVTHARVRSVTLREIIGSLESLDCKITAGIDALKKRPVVGVTASSLHSGKYDKVLGDFDLVVIDEAAQLTVPATVGCISFGKKFVLIGDHRQLPPVVQSEGLGPVREVAGNGSWSDLSKSLFEILYERALEESGREVILLKDQYRMNDQVCSIPSNMYYAGSLRPANTAIAQARLKIDVGGLAGLERLVLEPHEPVKFIDTPLDGRAGPRTNLREAELVCGLVMALVRAGLPLDRPDALGIVCPRRAQVELVRRELEKSLGGLAPSGVKTKILDAVSTVDRFQGSQRDVIIVSLGMTDDVVSQHLADERRLNVAMSRARHKLIFLGNIEALGREPLFATLFETMDRELPYSGWRIATS
ncbi:MAG: AAA domain-containing protein, partial [Desulfomonilaceae bacterium]